MNRLRTREATQHTEEVVSQPQAEVTRHQNCLASPQRSGPLTVLIRALQVVVVVTTLFGVKEERQCLEAADMCWVIMKHVICDFNMFHIYSKVDLTYFVIKITPNLNLHCISKSATK